MNIETVLKTLDGVFDLVRGMKQGKEVAALNAVIDELRNQLWELRRAQLVQLDEYEAALKANRELREEIAALRQEKDERECFALRELAPGVNVYVKRDAEKPALQKQWYCQKCFDEGRKVVLQDFNGTASNPVLSTVSLGCPGCRSVLTLGKEAFFRLRGERWRGGAGVVDGRLHLGGSWV